jgi:hypothetical protein
MQLGIRVVLDRKKPWFVAILYGLPLQFFTILFLTRQGSLLLNNLQREEISTNFAFILLIKDVKILNSQIFINPLMG